MSIQLPRKLREVFDGPARYRGAYGGRGSGKSMGFALMCLVRGLVKPERILCAREVQNTIRDSVHRELVDAIQSAGMEDHYNYGESFIRGKNGTEFLFKGLRHNVKEIKSTTGVTICWVEEAEAVRDESWRLLIPTIREPGSEIWLTWNPEEEEAATDTRFIQNPPPKSRIVKLNWRDNPWFPQELEEARQHDLATLDKRVYEHIWEGKTLSQTGSEIYYNFDQEIHVDESADYDPSLPILWAHDFNIGVGKPMSSCLCQIRKTDGKPSVCVFDEIIIPTADTNEIVKEFKGRHSHFNVVIYGDSSGNSRDTRSKTTDYLILSAAGYKNQKVPNQNPPIRERHNAVNALLKAADGTVKCKIHPRCKTIIKGLKTVKIKEGAHYLEEETYWQHVTTAFGYFVNVEFPALSRTVKKATIGGI